ncbi:MAG: hypothetical protein JW751_17910 [Polyangiaceae bacterium]|nr:hypothetical protein [Polyangiaceae bacterium]
MKTTVEIADALFLRAKKLAKTTGRPMRALVEEGLRRVLEQAPTASRYRLPDCRVGVVGSPNPLEAMDWPALRGEIYGER